MRRKIVIICILIIVIAITIIVWQSPLDLVLELNERGISSEKVLKEMPNAVISLEESELLDNLKKSPEIIAMVRSGTSVDWIGEEARTLLGDMLPESNECIVSVFSDAIYVFYKVDSYSVYLTLFPDGSVVKTIGMYRANGDVKLIYENHDNETYLKYRSQYRIRFSRQP